MPHSVRPETINFSFFSSSSSSLVFLFCSDHLLLHSVCGSSSSSSSFILLFSCDHLLLRSVCGSSSSSSWSPRLPEGVLHHCAKKNAWRSAQIGRRARLGREQDKKIGEEKVRVVFLAASQASAKLQFGNARQNCGSAAGQMASAQALHHRHNSNREACHGLPTCHSTAAELRLAACHHLAVLLHRFSMGAPKSAQLPCWLSVGLSQVFRPMVPEVASVHAHDFEGVWGSAIVPCSVQ